MTALSFHRLLWIALASSLVLAAPAAASSVGAYALNRPWMTTDGEGITVSYLYDASGNRRMVSDGRAIDTSFQYDGLNRLIAQTEQTGKTTYFTYDGVNKTSRVDPGLDPLTQAAGRVTNYTYDARHRLVLTTYPGAPLESLTYAYDAAGHLLSAADGVGHGVAYTYSAQGLVLTEQSQGVVHYYGYDVLGNRRRVQYGRPGDAAGRPLGRQIDSEYDSRQRLMKLTEGSRETDYTYDAAGNVVTKRLPDGEVVTTTYDGLNRKTTEEGVSAAGGAPVSLYKYLMLYDQVGNLCLSSEVTQGVVSRMLVMDYDQADRLASEYAIKDGATNGQSTLYTYDNSNNRVSKVVQTEGSSALPETTIYEVSATDNLLRSLTSTAGLSVSYTYDENGNRATRTTDGRLEQYGYDRENRLISWQRTGSGSGPQQCRYSYDYRTRRVERVEDAVATTVVFSGGTSVQEYAASAASATTPSVEYVRGSDWGGGVGGLLYSLRANAPSFAHFNSRGDVVAHTNASGTLTYQASYEADGTHAVQVGSPEERQQANTKEEDPTGLLNEGMRYRDLESGTFITRDPAGLVDGPNEYAYVRQNPWSKFDPEGLWIGGDDAIAAGGGALIAVGIQGAFDLWHGHLSSYKDYVAAAVGGAAAGEAALYTGGLGAGAAYGAASNLTKQGLNNLDGTQHGLNVKSLVVDTAVGAVAGKAGEVVGESVAAFRQGLAGTAGAVEGSAAATVAQTEAQVAGSNKGPITWVDEAHGNSSAAAYEAGAPGHIPGKAPRLSATDAEGTVTAKFDGVDGSTMVDRKLSVTTFPKSERQMLRQSAVAAENGYGVRWEVPNNSEATRAQKMAESLGVENIDVQVRK